MNMRYANTAALLLTTLGSAQAASFTQAYTLAPTLTDMSSFVELAKFDPAMGTLQSISIGLYGTLGGSGGVENLQTKKASIFSLTLTGDVQFVLPGVASLSASNVALLSETVTLAKFDGTRDRAGSSGQSYTYSTDISATTTIDPLQFGAFIGEGVVSAPISATASSAIAGPSTRFASFDTNFSGRVVVTYDYLTQPPVFTPPQMQPVPEPTTWALMFAGLGVVGWLARRRAA